MKRADLLSLSITLEYVTAENASLRAALRLIADRQHTADRVYELCGIRTAGEIARAALDGELFGRGEHTRSS